MSVLRRMPQLRSALLMIKLTAILLLAGCLHVSATGYGQRITLSKKQASLADVFLDIHRQTGYFFYYSEALLDKANKVTISVKDAELTAVLDLCFRGQPLQYEIDDKVIYVVDKHIVLTTADTTYIVSGKILSVQDEPVTNATVQLQPQGNMVTTDDEGFFQIPLATKNSYLLITCIGFQEQKVLIGNNNNMLIRLRRSDNKLDEVQVIAYGTSTRRYNTGNIAKVTQEEIARQPVSNPIAAVQGRVAGVSIQQTTGVPGGGFTVNLRGRNSLRDDGNDLLYIVDGIPYPGSTIASPFTSVVLMGGSPLSALNPNDIESIEVLKDADATAIYGSRAANGIVLITTKKGRTGKTQFQFNGYTGWGKVANKMELLSREDYLVMRREAFKNDAVSVGGNDMLRWDTTRYTDWQKELVGGTARINNLDVGISGGNQQTQFLVSGTYRHETTVFPGDFRDKKGAVHFNVSHRSSNQKLRVSLGGNYVSDNNNLIYTDLMSRGLTLAPVAPPLYTPQGDLNWENSTWQNPMGETRKSYLGRTSNLLGNATISYNIFEGFELKANLGYSQMNLKETNIQPAKASDPAFPYSGAAAYSTSDIATWIIEPQMSYHKSFELLEISVLLGLTFQDTHRERIYMDGSQFASDNVMTNPAAAAVLNISEVLDSRYRYQAAFGRVQLHWAKRYLLSFTGRRDGSSRFGKGNQFGNFGAIGAGWIFSKESWLNESKSFLSFGKIRASYGSTGSDQIGDYGYIGVWNFSEYPYTGIPTLQPANLANPNFRWESNRKLEAGLELGFLRDRIFATASYYRNRSGNQLVGLALPMTTGFNSVQYNLDAELQNAGWEFELNSSNLTSSKVIWITSLNLSFPRTKLISFPNLEGTPYSRDYVVGQSTMMRKAFEFSEVDPETGMYQFVDANKDGSISYPGDLSVYRPLGIRTLAGMNNSVQWKGIKLDFLVQGVQQDAYTSLPYFDMPGTSSNQPISVMNRWQQKGDQSDVQKFSQNRRGSVYASSAAMRSYGDKTISDASYIRLKNVSLSFDFPSEWCGRNHIQNFSVYVLGQNLLTYTNYDGLDPETLSFRNIPPLRVFTVGCRITL